MLSLPAPSLCLLGMQEKWSYLAVLRRFSPILALALVRFFRHESCLALGSAWSSASITDAAPSSSYGCLAPWRISMVQQCHLSPFSLRQGGTTHHCRVASSVDAVMVTGRRQRMKWAFGLPACVWRQKSGNVLCTTAVPPRRPLRATPG